MTEQLQPESEEIAFGVYRAGTHSQTVSPVAPTIEPPSEDAADDQTPENAEQEHP